MQNTQAKTLVTGRRVQGALDTHAAAIGNAVPASTRAEFDAAVAQLATYQLEQESTDAIARGESANQEAYQKDVYKKFLKPIGRIARRWLSGAPELPELVVPARSIQTTSALVAKAKAAADAAAKYSQTFVERGMSPDFVAQFQTAIGKVNTSVDSRGRHMSRRFTATDGLKKAEKSVRDLIGVLDSLLTPALENYPDALSDWNASKRIHQTVVTPLPSGDAGDSSDDASGTDSSAPTAPALVQSTATATKAA